MCSNSQFKCFKQKNLFSLLSVRSYFVSSLFRKKSIELGVCLSTDICKKA